MKVFQGIWLPDGEKHFPEWMARNGEIVDGRGTYQIKKIRAALGRVKSFRRALDVGGHVGLWAMHLIPRFRSLDAFEPVEDFRRCFVRNVESAMRASACTIALHDCALGAEAGTVGMSVDPADTGGTHVKGAGTIPLRKLDEFGFSDVDFIKIDCEGYEEAVVKGGIETISRSKPTIIVEQKKHKLAANFGIAGTPAVDLLRSIGYVVDKEIGGDYIMVFP